MKPNHAPGHDEFSDLLKAKILALADSERGRQVVRESMAAFRETVERFRKAKTNRYRWPDELKGCRLRE